jgi:hypothetical protein
MTLDMTGFVRFNPDAHFRRYLNNSGRIIVVYVQDFDYRDYDESRFVDHLSFGTEVEAESAVVHTDDVREVASSADPDDTVTRAQAERLIRAIERHNRH